MIEIVLLGEPVAKGRPRFSQATGHAYTPEKTRSYEQMLRLAATDVMGDRPPLEGPLKVDMRVVKAIPRSWPKKKQEAARTGALLPTNRPDFDNFAKVVDSCNLVIWVDDGQIVDARIRKLYGQKPGLWLTVTPITGVFE